MFFKDLQLKIICFIFAGGLFFLAGSNCCYARSQPDAVERYQQALKLAHDGHSDQALPIMAQLTRQFPDELRYRYDYIQILLWAGQKRKVLDERRQIDLNVAPDYVLQAIGLAARDQKAFVLAKKCYRQLLQRHPHEWHYQLKLAQILIDQKKLSRAGIILQQLKKNLPGNPDVLSVIRYAEETEQEEKHQQAIQLARQGNTAKALKILQLELQNFPQRKRYFFDYLQVLFWAGHYKQVQDKTQAVKLTDLPDFVLQTIALSARYENQFARAENCYGILLERHPKAYKYLIGLAAVLIDQNKTEPAKTIIDAVLQSEPQNLDALKILAYRYEQEENYIQAADVYDRILYLSLDDKEAIRGRVFALSRGQFFNQAWQAALLYRKHFSDEEWIKLHWDLAANMIRWGEIPAKSGTYRYAETHQAITRIHHNLEMLDEMDLPNADSWRARAHFDLLVALRDASQMREAVSLFQSLVQSGITLPAYARIAAADAFLYLEQPEQARDLYLEVLKEIPGSYNARQALVYAYLEAEQPELASNLARQMARQQPKKLWFRNPNAKGRFYSRGNPRKTETELAVAVMDAFSDRLYVALEKIEFLYKNASFNTDIRNVRANIYYYRGWPRQAYEQLISALNIEPEHLQNRISLSRVLHELRDYSAEQRNTESLYRRYYENKGVQQLKRLWNIHNQRELRIRSQGQFSNTQSNIPSPVNGSESAGVDSLLFSQPLAYHYRLFVHQNWQTGVFSNGLGQTVRGYFQRYGLGLEYARPDLTATGELHYDIFQHNTVGFAGTVNYQFDDYWSAGVQFDSKSKDIGLRALTSGRVVGNQFSGVTALSIASTLRYRLHESREFSLKQQFFDYSDNNIRYDVNGQYYERWYSSPFYKFATYLNMGTSLNTRQTGNYYHPENDATVTLTLDQDILTYRHYDFTFYQRLALTSGFYYQKQITSNAGARVVSNHLDPIGSIQYEHRWKNLDRYELVYGAIRQYAIYDGDRTNSWSFYLNLSLRF